MRITAKTKEATREKILRSAEQLFAKRGFEQTSTRDIAKRAGIATGTLFNYFPGKEAVGLALVAEALLTGREEFVGELQGTESLEELLFAHVATGIRRLRPYRRYVMSVLESTLSPLGSGPGQQEADSVRADHLETVRVMIVRRGGEAAEPSSVIMHLYWTLFLGILSFWARDESEHQEDTLALLDQSMKLFIAALPGVRPATEPVLDRTDLPSARALQNPFLSGGHATESEGSCGNASSRGLKPAARFNENA